VSDAGDPVRELAGGAHKQRPAVVRKVIPIPGIVGRGRATLRHFIALLLGGYISWVRARRARGAHGLVFRLQAMVATFFRPFVGTDLARQTFPVQLRRRLEMLGPTYVKLGQILSLRRDLLPATVIDELQNLLSRLPEVPFATIVEIIESDLAQPLDEMFPAIDPVPLGSASIAQIHRATTCNGDKVILKVVKPGIRNLLYRDAYLLRLCSYPLQWLIPRYQPKQIVEEFFEYTLREVEMQREAENAELFAANFKDMPEIVFPKVFREYSGERVLCMEFLEGVPPDVATLHELTREERTKLIDLGASAIIRMLYSDGFFHADLHPGNLMVLPGTRVGFIDLGMVGRLDPELRHNTLLLYYSLVMEDFESAARYLVTIALQQPGSDTVGFRRAVKDLSRRWRRSATFEEFSLAQLILESVRLGARYRLYFPVEMVLMVKALVTYEGVGYMLDPDFNVAEVSERHIGQILRQQLNLKRMMQEGMRMAPQLIDAVAKLPVLVSESIRLLERSSRQRPEGPISGLRATLLGGFCLVSGAILAGLEGPQPIWIALLVIGTLISLRRGGYYRD
jgi:ubiquinone biosynthesis protein